LSASVSTDLELSPPPPAVARIRVTVRRPLQDRVFRAVVRAAGACTLGVMAIVFASLVIRSSTAVQAYGLVKFVTSRNFQLTAGRFGTGGIVMFTIAIALVAIVVAVPVSIGAALFVNEYAPRPFRRTITSLIDLLAAVPGVIYGIWGLFFFTPRARLVAIWLTTHLGFIPIFKTTTAQYTGSTFIAGMVLALMVTPTVTAIVREVFAQAPAAEREGVLALGGTRWGVIRTVILPFGRGGIIGGTMLGLGRALGETIAVVLLISYSPDFSIHILQQGTSSIASLIAQDWSEASSLGLSALMAAGVLLFVLTLVVNAIASVIVSRSRSGATTQV
jgi:phosphate transport system permease protein